MSIQAFLEALGEVESGRRSGDPAQYRVENALGFIGKYQFGEALLIDLNYYRATVYCGAGAMRNNWAGTWTGKRSIRSKEQLLASPEVQEIAIREAFALNLRRIRQAFEKERQSLDQFLDKVMDFPDGRVSRPMKVTLCGVLAAAHLRGPFALVELLLRRQVSRDQNNVSILDYLGRFAVHTMSEDEFRVEAPASHAVSTYVVKRGDTLERIAQAVYGDGSFWREIYEANRDVIARPDSIWPDMVLKIPQIGA